MTAGPRSRPKAGTPDEPGAVIAARAPLRLAAPAGRHVVVVVPARGDSGNLAVMDALLELTGGPADLVLGSSSGTHSPLLEPPRATVQTLPALLTGTKQDRRTAVILVERLLPDADHVTVIAPDGIGTREDVHALVRCLALARTAASAGIDTRVLGFTWSLGGGSAGILAVDAAARAGVQLHARDDLSLIRALNEGLSNVRPAADLAFAAARQDRGLLDTVEAQGRPLAVLSVCAAVIPGSDPAADYVAIAEHLHRRGLHVVLLPSAPTGFDLLLLGRVARAVGAAGRTSVIRRALGSAELRALAAAAQVTVTDRTRTAVVALSAGAPVVGLSTHRELEGLLRTTGFAAWSVLPKPGFGSGAQRVVDAILDSPSEVRAAVRRSVPEFAERARGALTGLPVTTADRRSRLP